MLANRFAKHFFKHRLPVGMVLNGNLMRLAVAWREIERKFEAIEKRLPAGEIDVSGDDPIERERQVARIVGSIANSLVEPGCESGEQCLQQSCLLPKKW